MNIGIALKQTFADYSTISVYGEKGFEKKTLNFIKENSDPEDYIVSRRDFKFIIYNDFLKEMQGDILPWVKEFISNNYVLVANYGNYYIYLRKKDLL